MTSDGPDVSPTATVTHVGMCVTDLDQAEAFYRGAFGFERLYELSPPDGVTGRLLGVEEPVGLTAVYLGLGNFTLELLHFDRDGNEGRRRRPFTEPGLTHLSLSVHELEPVLDRVRELGGSVVEESHVGVAVLVRDPDGQVVELVAQR